MRLTHSAMPRTGSGGANLSGGCRDHSVERSWTGESTDVDLKNVAVGVKDPVAVRIVGVLQVSATRWSQAPNG